ncbi:PHM/PNGase F [Rhizoclosmatium globosum]|uniref:peptidylglycine monooxygenase n=1 Tax=Rhizoclosmatium globosum TaxID=329046 RepID=A0A1Y2BGD8_9FUNG|nr:PHM/PNGase F [Rhizoclosmatium globosum]|eukprot:ORY33879.1 PHM/PNGase F [Rhizoclosmatium globosum]
MGGMHGADIWILRQNGKGEYYMQDSFSTTTATPIADSQQDVELLTAPDSAANHTVFTFMRPLKTCDPDNDHEIKEGLSQHLIWAYGSSEGSLNYHGPKTRGNAAATLFHDPSSVDTRAESLQAVQALQAASELKVFEIQFPNVTVPPAHTTYLCTHFQVPADRKYHVVQYEAILTTKLVHHMIIYGCVDKPKSFGDLYECASMSPSCSKFTLAWAPGIGLNVLPKEVGFPFGTGTNALRYFSLQIHYNNPNALSNIIDSSGMRLFYTTQLRPNDMGVLILGDTNFNISGNDPSYYSTQWNVCPTACTKQFPTNLTIINNFFHMHMLGQNSTTRQIRDGKEIVPLGAVHYYDFNFQGGLAPFQKGAVISPGDTLLTKCAYIPTLNVRSNYTVFGESTEDEMCFNFLTYYPAMSDIEFCLSGDNATNPQAACGNDLRMGNKTRSQLEKEGLLVPAPFPVFEEYKAPVCTPSFVVNPKLSGIVTMGLSLGLVALVVFLL